MRRRSILLALALVLVGAAPRPDDDTEVDTALVLAFDVSGSVSEDRLELQRRGAAEALRSAAFIEAVSRGPRHGIAIAVFEWAGYGEQQVIVGWTTVRSAETATAIAENLLAAPRLFNGPTAVGEAINFGAALLDTAPKAERRVIDVSGDGRANAGSSTTEARDAAVAIGITINGLPILDVEEGLDRWYRTNVQGGPRSFTMPARTIDDYRESLLAKILREIS